MRFRICRLINCLCEALGLIISEPHMPRIYNIERTVSVPLLSSFYLLSFLDIFLVLLDVSDVLVEHLSVVMAVYVVWVDFVR